MLCNFVQFGHATMSKNVLQLCPKRACKKQEVEKRIRYEQLKQRNKSSNITYKLANNQLYQECISALKACEILDASNTERLIKSFCGSYPLLRLGHID